MHEPPVEVARDQDGVRSLRTLFALTLESGGALRVAAAGSVRRLEGGSRVRAAGILVRSRGPRNPGDSNRRGQPLLAVPHPANVQVLPAPRWPGLPGLLGRTRGAIVRLLSRMYPERTAGFILSMLLGDRRLLQADMREALLATGTYHLLAISGLHVVLIMALFLRLPLPPRVRTPARLLFLAAFTALTGANPPVVRAALMISIHLLLQGRGRSPQALNTLGWTAFILLGADPTLLWDVGFQLSFAAVLAILTWSARLSRLQGGAGREKRSGLLPSAAAALRASLAISVGTSVATAPLILLHFQRVHLLGPIWNLLGYPLTVVSLAGGGLSLALGALHPALGSAVARAVDPALEGLLQALAAGARLPGSNVPVPSPPVAVLLLCGVLLVLGLWRRWSRWTLAAGLAGLLLACGAALVLPRPVELWTFDAGRGDAALLCVPGAGSILVDAGAAGDDAAAGAILAREVLATGNRRLRGVLLTHPHWDHLRGFDGLLDRLPAGEIWTSPLFASFPLGRRSLEAARASGVPARAIPGGCRLRFAGAPELSIDILHPPPPAALLVPSGANDTSVAARVSYAESRLLFLGDLEEEGLARLFLGEPDLRAEVLIAPHHGRPNRLWPALLERVRPGAVVASGSGEGGAEETARALEAAGLRVFATWRGGAVRTIWTRGKGWQPRYWRQEP